VKTIFWKLVGGPVVHGHRTVSSIKLGVLFVIFSLAIGWASFNKVQIREFFTPSRTIKVHFAANNVIIPYYSKAKVNFVPVGLVTGLDKLGDGTAMVTIEVSPDIPGKLGTAPTAVLRPTTILGGYYFVDLAPGGDPGEFTAGTIPLERTKLPVELDKLLRAFQPNALEGLRGLVKESDETLAGGGREALQRLVSDSPGSLKPTGEVLDALRGTRPNRDLTDFVEGFESTARVLTDRPGQLRAIAVNLAVISAAFGEHSAEFSEALEELPGTLTSADRGLRRLNTTLDTLRDTASDIRPSAQHLGRTLDRLDPVLAHARPVVRDLRHVIHEARPLLEDLVPVVRKLTDVFDDLSGPVLDRVNGPIKDLILGTYQGSGPYVQTRTDKPVFQELAYMAANLDRATFMDRTGGAIDFQPMPEPEVSEHALANNGPPRFETLQRSLTDPQRINPPLQVGPQPPHPGAKPLSNPLLPSAGAQEGGQ